jgi:hypothetical protein
MRHAWLVLLLAAASLSAQLRISLFNGAVEQPLGSVYDIGQVAIGDSIDTQLRVRNLGTGPVSIDRLRVAGDGFSVPSGPPLPFVLAANGTLDFRVRVLPSAEGNYSANLTVNQTGLILLARATPGLTVAVELDSGWQVVAVNTTVALGSVLRGQTLRRNLALRNPGQQAVPLSVLRVANAAGANSFRLVGVPALPTSVAGGTQLDLVIEFVPAATAGELATLEVDGRMFRLQATGLAAEVPPPTIVVDGTYASGQQLGVRIVFPRPLANAIQGTLRWEFSTTIGVADPTLWLSGPGIRQVNFQVAEGQTEARFGSSNSLILQTGSTMGRFLLQATIGTATNAPQATKEVSIAGAPVGVVEIRTGRRVNDLDVTILAFDNTRTAGMLVFQFFDQAGQPVGGAIRADASPDFRQYFARSTTGGGFALRATFPVTGPIEKIGSVEVELVNSVGSTKSDRIKF